MKYLSVFLFVFLMRQAIAQDAGVSGMDATYLTNNYFSTVSMTSSNLLVTFKQQGQRYLYSINDGPLKKGNYGETISIKIGETLKLIGKGNSIEFSVLPEKIKSAGFDVKEVKERMSVSGTISSSNWFMIKLPQGEGQNRDMIESIRLVEPKTEIAEKILSNKGH